MAVEGKGMSKCVMQQGKSSITLVSQKKLRTKTILFLGSAVADARKGKAICC